jgi:urease accessory protein
MVVSAILGRLEQLQPRASNVDAVELTAEQRQRAHLRVRSREGRELAISLPRGVELQAGDVLAFDGEVALAVAAAAEDLLEVAPASARQWGVAAYQLGNLHREVRFLEDVLLTPYDHTSEEVMQRSQIASRRVQRGFVGERYGAYTGGLHHHHHEHGH